jgi:hypothetical protein
MRLEYARPAAVCALISLLIGCATTSPSFSPRVLALGPAIPCTPGVCEIQVTVKDCAADNGIALDKPYVSADDSVVLRWTIVTSGYEFTSQGIQIDPPDRQFKIIPQGQKNTFMILDQHKKVDQGDPTYYFVNIQKVDGPACKQLDPFIRNN